MKNMAVWRIVSLVLGVLSLVSLFLPVFTISEDSVILVENSLNLDSGELKDILATLADNPYEVFWREDKIGELALQLRDELEQAGLDPADFLSSAASVVKNLRVTPVGLCRLFFLGLGHMDELYQLVNNLSGGYFHAYRHLHNWFVGIKLACLLLILLLTLSVIFLVCDGVRTLETTFHTAYAAVGFTGGYLFGAMLAQWIAAGELGTRYFVFAVWPVIAFAAAAGACVCWRMFSRALPDEL